MNTVSCNVVNYLISSVNISHLQINYDSLFVETFFFLAQNETIIIKNTTTISAFGTGARFSKDPVTYRARNHILKSKSQEK